MLARFRRRQRSLDGSSERRLELLERRVSDREGSKTQSTETRGRHDAVARLLPGTAIARARRLPRRGCLRRRKRALGEVAFSDIPPARERGIPL
jgi:hypothetical protein